MYLAGVSVRRAEDITEAPYHRGPISPRPHITKALCGGGAAAQQEPLTGAAELTKQLIKGHDQLT
jgi:hypothetical protein